MGEARVPGRPSRAARALLMEDASKPGANSRTGSVSRDFLAPVYQAERLSPCRRQTELPPDS